MIKYETIDEEMIKDIMEGRAPANRPVDWDDNADTDAAAAVCGEADVTPLVNPQDSTKGRVSW